jgi:UDP-N-acetylmuramoylalanine--D-glutamate ligase
MKIGIVGWGLETQSAYKYFGPQHEYLIVNESQQDNFPPESEHVKVHFLANKAPIGIPGQVQDLGYLQGIDAYDKIIYQPTAYFNLKKVFGDNPGFWAKATTVYDIFFEHSPTKNVIGVTGSKGKGTTSTLIAKMLQAASKTVHLGGNIGTPILDLLPDIKPDDWLVWELANFQLKAASYSPHIAVCLMITEEHLDWHPDIEDYIKAKANMFSHQKADDIAVYFAKNEYSKKIASYSPGKKIPYYESPGAYVRKDGMIVIGQTEVINKKEVKLLGEHNLQNICAALTAVFEAVGSVDKAAAVLSSFSGLEHRLELVRELEGIKYYDDSFATTPEAAVVALKAFGGPKVVILGGSDKGLAFEPLADEVVRSNVRQVIAIGTTAGKIASMLKSRGFTNITLGLSTMPEIVAAARRAAQPGDVVLLSTGCASFGLFKDYKERGNQFKEAVRELS